MPISSPADSNRILYMAEYLSINCKGCGAMKILKRYDDPGAGKIRWYKSRKITCSVCGAEYEYKGDELEVVEGPDDVAI